MIDLGSVSWGDPPSQGGKAMRTFLVTITICAVTGSVGSTLGQTPVVTEFQKLTASDAAPRTINTRHILDGQKKGAERAVETVPWDPVLHPAPRSDLSHLLRLVATRMMSFGLAERARAQKPTGERTYLRGMRVTRYHS